MGEDKIISAIGWFINDKPIDIDSMVNSSLTIDEGEPKYTKTYDGCHNISFDITVQIEEGSALSKLMNKLEKEQKEFRKKLLWYVTHGHYVVVNNVKINDEEGTLVIKTPRMLKCVLRQCPVFDYNLILSEDAQQKTKNQ